MNFPTDWYSCVVVATAVNVPRSRGADPSPKLSVAVRAAPAPSGRAVNVSVCPCMAAEQSVVPTPHVRLRPAAAGGTVVGETPAWPPSQPESTSASGRSRIHPSVHLQIIGVVSYRLPDPAATIAKLGGFG